MFSLTILYNGDMKYGLCKIEELEELYDFYNVIIDHQKYDMYSPDWTKDVYPSKKDLEDHLKNDLVYVLKDEEKIIGAGIISLKEDPIYKNGNWSIDLKDEQIAVLHLFAVLPEYRGRGLALKLLEQIVNETEKTSKAIHLDAVKGNLAASRMYLKAGFDYRGDKEVWYEDTGDIIVELFEYVY